MEDAADEQTEDETDELADEMYGSDVGAVDPTEAEADPDLVLVPLRIEGRRRREEV